MAGPAHDTMGKSGFATIPIDRVAEYWNARPCNVRHSPQPLGTREYFDEVERRKYFVEPHIPTFAEFDRWRGKRVLEIGCGIGTDTMNFARRGARVTAVDLSEQSVEIARRRAKEYGLGDRIKFFVGNAEELSEFVPLEAYDLVYSFGVIHHTPHPDRVISQVRRYLRPGGTLKVMVYHRRSWKALTILLAHGQGRWWGLDEILARHSEAETGCPITYTYLPRQIPALLERFRIREMTIEHIFPYRVPEYVQHRYRKVWHFQLMPQPAFRWLEHHFGWHLCVTAEMC